MKYIVSFFLLFATCTVFSQKLLLDPITRKYECVDSFSIKGLQQKAVFTKLKAELNKRFLADDIYVTIPLADPKTGSIETSCHFKVMGEEVFSKCKLYVYVQKEYVHYYFTDFMVEVDDAEASFERSKTILDKYSIFEKTEISMALVSLFLKAAVR